MPKKYEEIRDDLISRGLSRKEAEGRAARIYNSQRKPSEKAVGPYYHKKHARKQ